jgi:hypothetical protein
MPVHLKSALFVILGTLVPAVLIACVVSTEECQAQTPAEKKALEADKKALDLQKKKALEAQKKMLEMQKKAIDLQNQALAKIAMEGQKKREAAALMSAYMLLSAANSDYAGHRERALHQVRAALTIVDLIGMKQSEPRIKALQDLNKLVSAPLPGNRKGEAFASQIVSDAQLARAATILLEVAPSLRRTKSPQPLAHVDNALMEINAALRSSAANAMKGREADVLTYAYILLASANHDYAGRRVQAMHQLKEACNILEGDILSIGTVAQRIKAIRDANAQALALGDGNAAPALNQIQYISDAHLLMADTLIQRVGFFLNATKTQPRVLNHLGNADREIGIALMIR